MCLWLDPQNTKSLMSFWIARSCPHRLHRVAGFPLQSWTSWANWVQSFCPQPSSIKPIRPEYQAMKAAWGHHPNFRKSKRMNTVTKIIENHKPEMQDIHGYPLSWCWKILVFTGKIQQFSLFFCHGSLRVHEWGVQLWLTRVRVARWSWPRSLELPGARKGWCVYTQIRSYYSYALSMQFKITHTIYIYIYIYCLCNNAITMYIYIYIYIYTRKNV